MKISENSDGSWVHYNNLDAVLSDYKLHVFIDLNQYDFYHEVLFQKLKDAVDKGVIAGFKRLNHGSSEKLISEIGSAETPVSQNPRARLRHNPFTIYLHKFSDMDEVATLCQAIELTLSETKTVQSQFHSKADIPISPHVTFRKESLDGEYVTIATASEQTQSLLEQQGRESLEFNSLSQTLHSKLENTAPSDEVKLSAHDKSILNFYNQYFPYYNKTLHSRNINEQFIASCTLLNLDPETLKNTKKEDWGKMIDSAYRKASIKFHADKVTNKNNTQLVECANQLFSLLKMATCILNDISRKPSVLDLKDNLSATLTQELHIPKYQFELHGGYTDDPYYYVRMAHDEKEYLLRKNWNIETNREDLKVESESSTSDIVIYKPQLITYSRGEKIERLPGHEAFKQLFLAGALPSRFDQGHLEMCFTNHNKVNRFLIKDALTNSAFLNYMDTNDVIDLAKRATNEGLLTIGNNTTDIFIYFYNNFPETIYENRVEKFLQYNDFDKSRINRYLLENPSNLAKLGFRAVDKIIFFSDEILKVILDDMVYFKNLSSYGWHYRYLIPLLKRYVDDFTPLTYDALLNGLLGDDGHLKYLSNSQIQLIIDFITKQNDVTKLASCTYLPMWTADIFYNELARRQHQESVVLPFVAQYKQNDALIYNTIIASMMTGDMKSLYSLNADSLLKIAADPNLDGKFNYFIVRALVKLGERDLAINLLTTSAIFTEVAVGKQVTVHQFYDYILNNDNALLAVNEKLLTDIVLWRSREVSRISSYLQTHILTSDNIDELATSSAKLKMLSSHEDFAKFENNMMNVLTSKLSSVLTQIQNGHDMTLLRNQIVDIKRRYSALNIDTVSEFSRFFENTMYDVLKRTIGINDSYDAFFTKEIMYVVNTVDVLDRLETLFSIYLVFGLPKKFYDHLGIVTGKSFDDSVINTNQFERQYLEDWFVTYLTNELAVYMDGYRENATYKTHRFVDNQNIRAFHQLRSMFLRMGKENIYASLLRQAFTKIGTLEYSWNGSAQDAKRPLNKYIEIRREESKYKDEYLENICIYERLEVIVAQFRSVEYDRFSFITGSTNNVALTLLEKFPHRREQDKQKLNEQISLILNLIKEFLQKMPNDLQKMEHHNLLINKIKYDPFLKDFFGILENSVGKERVIAETILTKIEHMTQSHQASPPPLPSTATTDKFIQSSSEVKNDHNLSLFKESLLKLINKADYNQKDHMKAQLQGITEELTSIQNIEQLLEYIAKIRQKVMRPSEKSSMKKKYLDEDRYQYFYNELATLCESILVNSPDAFTVHFFSLQLDTLSKIGRDNLQKPEKDKLRNMLTTIVDKMSAMPDNDNKNLFKKSLLDYADAAFIMHINKYDFSNEEFKQFIIRQIDRKYTVDNPEDPTAAFKSERISKHWKQLKSKLENNAYTYDQLIRLFIETKDNINQERRNFFVSTFDTSNLTTYIDKAVDVLADLSNFIDTFSKKTNQPGLFKSSHVSQTSTIYKKN